MLLVLSVDLYTVVTLNILQDSRCLSPCMLRLANIIKNMQDIFFGLSKESLPKGKLLEKGAKYEGMCSKKLCT